MKTTWELKKGNYKKNLPFYEVHYNGKYCRFSGKTKAEKFARSIGNDLFKKNNYRIDIVNTQTGQIYKYK